jgi:hypothetical protein
MDSHVRLCLVSLNQILTLNNDIPEGVISNVRPSFGGGFSFAADFILDILWVDGINYTVVTTKVFGKGGCQTSIAKNESDFGVAIVDFPIDEDYEKVNPFVTIFEEPLVIVQGYNKTTYKPNFADLLKKSMSSFSITLWIAILIVLLGISLLFNLKIKLIRTLLPSFSSRRSYHKNGLRQRGVEHRNPIFEIFSLFLQKHDRLHSDIYRRTLATAMSIASLVIISGYFCNLMSTEMVVVEKPAIIGSYEDIIAKTGLVSIFVKVLTDYEHFRDADEGSVEKQLWTIMTTERSTINDILIDPQGLDTIIVHMLGGALGRKVLILTRLFEAALRTTVCQLMKIANLEIQTLTWAAQQPGSPNYPKGVIVRQTDMYFVSRGKRLARHAIEAGLPFHLQRQMTGGFMPKGFSQDKLSSNLGECFLTEIVTEKPGYLAAGMSNFRLLVAASLSSMLLSLFVLLCERQYKKPHKPCSSPSKMAFTAKLPPIDLYYRTTTCPSLIKTL